jgi:hypothetical protein
MFAKLLANQDKMQAQIERMETHNKMLENQIAQQAEASTRAQGKLPARPEQGQREHCNAVVLRSGKELEREQPKKKVSFDLGGQASAEMEELNEEGPNPQVEKESEVEKEKEEPRVYTPPIPFPQRLKKKSNDKQFSKFAEMMRKLYVTMPFTEVITQAPSYARFLKDVITCRRTIEDVDTVSLNGECSAILQPRMPPKLEDPGSFSISCYINDIKIERAMCDLGASISLMPYSLCKKLNMGEPKPTSMILRLADRSSRFPRGVLKDVPVRVGNFYIPGDFVVLEMEEDNEIPILLGRPFLYTAGAIFDTTKGSITMRVGDEEIEFNLEKAQRGPSSTMTCNYLDLVDTYEMHDVPNLLMDEFDDLDYELPKRVDFWAILNEGDEGETQDNKGKESCSVELKPLPTSLRYEFLGPNSTFPIIVNASLDDCQTLKLLDVVREHKDAIGYSIDDLKGISPNLCMHEINLESDSMPSRERARRLNPIVGEVVKKEILKLLDAGIIFPVADSKWVSPIHVVPKKGGMTVVKNEKNELIPTRTVTGWRMCVDYRKLNQATRKDHFPLPFIDQMLERLAKHDYFCYLDGYSGFFQIPIHPQDQEKTTFTCPYGTFAYRRMPFGLCNAPGTFQRCMMAIFSEFIEKIMEVFMDDFSVYGSSFDDCLANLAKVLKRCIETNLVLNWEKCHFMVQEGIVLGHLVSRRGIEVDKAKIEVMEKLPPPKDVKGVRSFLGHAGFYRRFIKDFSKIAKPLTNLLCNDTKF